MNAVTDWARPVSVSAGRCLEIALYGASHAPEIAVALRGFPAGFRVDPEALQAFLDRRAPGRDELSTPRREADRPVFESGLREGMTDGGEIRAVIRNANARSGDYETAIPRPGHADWPAWVKYGPRYSFAGGGAFSGRMTAPLCIAGGLALQFLAARGIAVAARAVRIGGETDPERMREAILAAKAEGDSVGGIVGCEAKGLPTGLGGPLFDGLEGRVSSLVFGIPAVKAIEFGAGFAVAEMKGSENNDPYRIEGGRVRPETNHAGGILGGISTGETLTFRVAMKPTPSIYRPQRSVDLVRGENVEFSVRGRHDPCVVLRAIPCVEAAAALALADALLEFDHERSRS